MATIDFENIPDRLPHDIKDTCERHGVKFGYAAISGYMTVWPFDEHAETEVIFAACKGIMEHYGWVGTVDVNGCIYFVGDDWQQRADVAYVRGLNRLKAQYPQATKGQP